MVKVLEKQGVTPIPGLKSMQGSVEIVDIHDYRLVGRGTGDMTRDELKIVLETAPDIPYIRRSQPAGGGFYFYDPQKKGGPTGYMLHDMYGWENCCAGWYSISYPSKEGTVSALFIINPQYIHANQKDFKYVGEGFAEGDEERESLRQKPAAIRP